MLITIHMAAANFLKCPELNLSDEEAQRLAIAGKNVSDQYDTVLSPRAMAWLHLTVAGVSIYGPRLYVIAERKAAAAANSPANKQAQQPIQMGPVKVESKGKTNGAAGQEAKTPADLFGLNYSGALFGAAPDVV